MASTSRRWISTEPSRARCSTGVRVKKAVLASASTGWVGSDSSSPSLSRSCFTCSCASSCASRTSSSRVWETDSQPTITVGMMLATSIKQEDGFEEAHGGSSPRDYFHLVASPPRASPCPR